MKFRSIADLARTVRENVHRVPADVDLVVGIPRSGMLAADVIALTLNLAVTDLYSFLRNDPVESGRTRGLRRPLPDSAQAARSILLVDDSICYGRALRSAQEHIRGSGFQGSVTTCAIYATPASADLVDIAFEIVPLPRVFEWNVLHRERLAQCCVDIDGVLCVDPDEHENDDGSRYLDFLANARALMVPTYPVGHLVTSRLEKYRGPTEAWLAAQGIEFHKLHMLDGVDATERRQRSLHASFKAGVYRHEQDSVLFIESNPRQAAEIARLSGKPVLCHETQQLFEPGVSLANVQARAVTLKRKLARAAKRLAGAVIGR